MLAPEAPHSKQNGPELEIIALHMCDFMNLFSVRTFVLKQRDINRTLPYISFSLYIYTLPMDKRIQYHVYVCVYIYIYIYIYIYMGVK